jgi:hypothetical protein
MHDLGREMVETEFRTATIELAKAATKPSWQQAVIAHHAGNLTPRSVSDPLRPRDVRGCKGSEDDDRAAARVHAGLEQLDRPRTANRERRLEQVTGLDPDDVEGWPRRL